MEDIRIPEKDVRNNGDVERKRKFVLTLPIIILGNCYYRQLQFHLFVVLALVVFIFSPDFFLIGFYQMLPN